MTVDLNPGFTFDSLVDHDGNQLASAAGRAVVRSPGTSYNPLFIFGGPGVGKTHLLMAMGDLALSSQRNLAVEYVTIDAFAESYRAAVAAGEPAAFSNRFADVDLILFDDTHLIQSRHEIQAELVRVAELLRAKNRQLVFSGHVQPGAMTEVDPALIEILNAGLVVDISQPLRADRRRIIGKKLEERSATLSDDAIDVLADPDIGDVREVLSQLQRLVAFQAVATEPINAAVAAEVVRGRLSAPFRNAAGKAAIEGTSEFSNFFDDVASTLSNQIESWGERLKDEIARWKEEGYDTAVLEEFARSPGAEPFAQILSAFEAAVVRLKDLEEQFRAGAPNEEVPRMFRDPASVAACEACVGELQLFGTLRFPQPATAWTLGTFVAGDANQNAISFAREAVGTLGKNHNPLVVHGPLGVGKSHFLHALANQCLEFGGLTICCMSTHDLVREAERIHGEARDIWRRRYERLSAIFLDDFQLIGGQAEAGAILDLLCDLKEKGCQIVVTMSYQPSGDSDLSSSIREMLAEGTSVALEPPDRALKLDLIHSHFCRQGVEPSRDLLDYMADRHVSSLREIQAQCQRVVDEAARKQEELTPAFAREVLEGARPQRRRSSLGVRASGVLVAPGVGLRSTEKMIWDWPELSDRMVEDLD